MSDEYKRVLREWARQQLALRGIADDRVARVLDVRFDYDSARAWSSVTFEDAYFSTEIEWQDPTGRREKTYISSAPEEGAQSFGALLSSLFRIAGETEELLPEPPAPPAPQPEFCVLAPEAGVTVPADGMIYRVEFTVWGSPADRSDRAVARLVTDDGVPIAQVASVSDGPLVVEALVNRPGVYRAEVWANTSTSSMDKPLRARPA